MSVTEFW